MNWTARFIHGTEDLSDAYAVRIEVFCDEQGYRLEQELDELDRRPDTWHLVLYDGGYPAAAGRLYPKGDGVMGLGRLAVRKSYRGCGLGARMVEELGRKAAELGASIVVMHGDRQDSVLPMEESISRFEELYDCGVRYGVRLAQENVVRFRSSDNAYLRAMRDRLGEKAHFVLDLKQAVRCGHTLDDVIGAMGEHIAHVHVSDHDAERDCLPPGRGETDFQRLISRLREQRFHGTMVVELYRGNFEKAQDLVDSRLFLEEQIFQIM